MSNLGLLAGSSFMQIFISLQMWGEMPGGMVGRRPSRATCTQHQRKVHPSLTTTKYQYDKFFPHAQYIFFKFYYYLHVKSQTALKGAFCYGYNQWCYMSALHFSIEDFTIILEIVLSKCIWSGEKMYLEWCKSPCIEGMADFTTYIWAQIHPNNVYGKNQWPFSISYLHANLHVWQVCEGHFPGHQLPQQDGEAPHVCRTPVDLLWLLLQGCKGVDERDVVNGQH